MTARYEVSGYAESSSLNEYPSAEFVLRDDRNGDLLLALADPDGLLAAAAPGEVRCTVEASPHSILGALPLAVVTGMLPSELLAPVEFTSGTAPGLWSEIFGPAPRMVIDSDGDGIPDGSDLDDDNDGIPDSYEVLHGLNPLADDAEEDFDWDGLSNVGEYIAGTGADDPSSRFDSVVEGGSDGRRLTIRWTAVPGRRYSVLSWTDFRGDPVALADDITVTDEREQSHTVPIILKAGFLAVRAVIDSDPDP